MKRPVLLLPALLLTLLGAPAHSAADAGWDEVAFARSGECTLRVTGNGKVYRIAASGLVPGQDARYLVTNGNMRPLDWRVRADDDGEFARYYIPFRWHHTGGTVAVALDSPGCSVSTAFDWRRQGVIVH